MAIEKVRRKAAFADGFTAAGSVGFAGQVRVGGNLAAPTGSASDQRFGVLRVGSGLTSATQSTTALNSGALLMVGAGVLVGAPVASYNLVGELVVNTIAQAASGGYFTVGFTATANAYAAPFDVPWFIINPG